MANKNEKVLESFVAFCRANPELRFWQALRNWANVDFILFSNFAPHNFGKEDGWLKDTFPMENRNY